MTKTVAKSHNHHYAVSVLMGINKTPVAVGLHKHLGKSRIVWRQGNPVTPGIIKVISRASN